MKNKFNLCHKKYLNDFKDYLLIHILQFRTCIDM